MLNYKIALTNVWWSPNSLDARFFDDTNKIKEYFDNKGLVWSDLLNFNMGNSVKTSVTLRVSQLDATSITSYNYAVLNLNGVYRYYFVQCSQDSAEQVTCNLNLDDLTTNYFKYRTNIAPCVINRACLDRFVRHGENEYIFDFDIRSPLIINEGDNLPKVCQQRGYISFSADQSIVTDIDRNLKDGDTWWQYIYLTPNEYITLNFKDAPKLNLTNGVTTDCYCIVSPRRSFNIKGLIWEDNRMLDYVTNTMGAYIQSIKISPFSPFRNQYYTVDEVNAWNVMDERRTGLKSYPMPIEEGLAVVFLYSSPLGHFSQRHTYDTDETHINLPKNSIPLLISTFTKDNIVGVNYDFTLIPKIYSSSCIELIIKDYYGNEKAFSPMDLDTLLGGEQADRLLYVETLSPDITKSFVTFINGLFKHSHFSFAGGLSSSNDTSLPFSVNNESIFLANNKNFALMQESTRDYNLEMNRLDNKAIFDKGMLSTLTGIAQLSPASAISSFTNTAITVDTNYYKTKAQNDMNKLQEKFTLDNARSSPRNIKNSQGNILLPLSLGSSEVMEEEEVNERGVRIFYEIWVAKDIDLERYAMHLNIYGYSLEQVGKVSDYDNIRKYFNYLACEVESINAPISDIEKERLRERLKAVRFWTSDNVSYDLENYERWLEQ